MPAEPFRYRPVFGLVLSGVVVVLCVVGIWNLVAVADWWGLARAIWPLLFAATLIAAMFWRPRVVITDDGVTVVNVFRTFVVPWQAIERIDTRYAATLYTKAHRIAVWAAPSPGIRGATTISRSDVTNLAESSYGREGTVRPGDAVSSASGQVAFVLRQRWERLRDEEAPGVQDRPVLVKTHRVTIVALVVLAAASLLSAVV